MYSAADTPKGVGFPIRKSPDQRSLPSPRSLSQGATSFIASRCQGIHQMPFFRLRTSKTHAQKQNRTQASTHTKKTRLAFDRRQTPGIGDQKDTRPLTSLAVKDQDASNNRPTPIAGCQKPIHNVKEPEIRDQMSGISHQITDARCNTRSRNSLPPRCANRASLRLTASEFSLAACHSRHPAFAARTAQTGGADRDRTDDLLRAKQALSQLSYGPVSEDRRQG